MNRYTVVWDSDVEGAFIRYWVAGNSATRIHLTSVANWIDDNLSTEPETKGRWHDDLGARIVAVPVPSSDARVSATYEVWADDRVVRVVRLTFRGL